MMRKLILLNSVLQVTGVLGFILVSNLLAVVWLKMAILFLFFAISGIVILKALPKYEMKQSIAFSLLSALTFVIVYQVIGFVFYPGLVKDVSPFSSYHLFLSSAVFLIMFIFYNLCCTLLFFKKKGTES